LHILREKFGHKGYVFSRLRKNISVCLLWSQV
jgi:hypothetical protein